MDFSLTDFCRSVGKPKSATEICNAKARLQEQNDLHHRQQMRLEQNSLPLPPSDFKPEEEKDKSDVIDDREIVQTEENPENIDPLSASRAHNGRLCPENKLVYARNPETGERGKFIRAIPHFPRLFTSVQSYLPRYIFRVVHSASAGEVFVDEHRVTHFWSHAFKQHKGSSSFENFDFDNIRQQIKRHVGSYKTYKTVKRESFASHFVSTTDSFEYATYMAQRHLMNPDLHNVVIYVIDTYSLRIPLLGFLMAQALRAYDVLNLFPQWRTNYFMYGALTEWIFWDRIVASNVEKIRFGAPSNRDSKDNCGRLLGLQKILPVAKAASRPERSTWKGASRSVRHKFTYVSDKEDREREQFAMHALASRNGPLPTATVSVKNDKRASINNKSLQDVWDIVRGFESRNLLLIWIASLMTRTYYADSIVERVVERYPEAIEESFDKIKKHTETEGVYEEVLVYYMSGQGCQGRVDVNAYQNMMLACIKAWQQKVHLDKAHKFHGKKVYLVTGQDRPLRNLLVPRESGFMGRCTTERLLRYPQMMLTIPFLGRLGQPGRQVKPIETHEEHRLRIQRNPRNQIHGPGGIAMVITKPVYKDTSHHKARFRASA